MFITKTSIILFMYTNQLLINDNIYIESVKHTQIAMRVGPGNFTTNAKIKVMPNTYFYFSSNKQKEEANGVMEYIDYCYPVSHVINILHGLHVTDKHAYYYLKINNDIKEVSSNEYLLLYMNAGCYNIELIVDSIGITSPDLGGRFLSAWIYNKTDIPIPITIVENEKIITYLSV